MALHVSGKLCVIGLVLALLITAFSAPPRPADGTSLAVAATARVLSEPRLGPGLVTPSVQGPDATPRYLVRATGYNSHVNQTDHSPNITATGARTHFGIIAVSRDLLGGHVPYGSLVRIRDLGSYPSGRGAGKFQSLLDSQGLFIVEDTMHPRKTNQIDVWFESYARALNWGVRQVEIDVVRYGRTGPVLEYRATTPGLEMSPQLAQVAPE